MSLSFMTKQVWTGQANPDRGFHKHNLTNIISLEMLSYSAKG